MNYRLQAVLASLVMFAAMSASAETVLQKAKRDGIFAIARGDAEMNAAIAKARGSFGQFLDAFDRQDPDTGDFQVKIPVVDGDKREYFWVSGLTRRGNQFSGRINNRPEMVKTVEYGQAIAFPQSRIADWMYVDHGKTRGNFTTCVLLAREDPTQARELMAHLGLSCERHGS